MGPAVGWVEEGSQTPLWMLTHGAVLMGLIRKLHTTAAHREPPLWLPPRGQGLSWRPCSGHRFLWGGMARIWALAEVPRAWKSFWDAERWQEAGEPAEPALQSQVDEELAGNLGKCCDGGHGDPAKLFPAALGILSFKPASSTGKSCAESPTSHSQTFLGQAPVGPLHPWEMK